MISYKIFSEQEDVVEFLNKNDKKIKVISITDKSEYGVGIRREITIYFRKSKSVRPGVKK